MADKELSVKLRELACRQPTPLCEEWTREWQDDTDIDSLLDMFVRDFDSCTRNDYPPLDFIRENFRLEDLHRHNIYLDEEVSLNESESGYYVFLGHCTGTMWVTGFKAVTVYMRHDSKLLIDAFDGARVTTVLYDKSKALCKADRYSRVQTFNRKP